MMLGRVVLATKIDQLFIDIDTIIELISIR